MPVKNSTGVCNESIEDNKCVKELAAGGLHKYANPFLIGQEKDAWRKTHGQRRMDKDGDKKHVRES